MRRKKSKKIKSTEKISSRVYFLEIKKSKKKIQKKIFYSYKVWRKLTRRYRKNLFSGIVTVAGFILIWRGIWYLADSIPPLENPIVSILLGLGLLLFLGARARLIEF